MTIDYYNRIVRLLQKYESVTISKTELKSLGIHDYVSLFDVSQIGDLQYLKEILYFVGQNECKGVPYYTLAVMSIEGFGKQSDKVIGRWLLLEAKKYGMNVEREINTLDKV